MVQVQFYEYVKIAPYIGNVMVSSFLFIRNLYKLSRITHEVRMLRHNIKISIFIIFFSISNISSADFADYVPKIKDPKIIIQNNVLEKVYPVQVFLTTSRNSALKTRRFFIDKGFNKSYIKVTRAEDNTVFYRVFSGNYPTKKRANDVKKSIRKLYREYKSTFVKKK